MPVFTPPINLTGGFSNVSKYLFRVQKPFDEDTPEATSYLGTPIYSQLTFDSIKDTSLSDDIQRLLAEDFNMPHAIITVSQSKNIVKTAVQGRGGTVKEFIADGDYSLRIDGLIVGREPLKYPLDDVKKFKAFCEINKTIDVSSNFLNIFNIGSIVIDFFEVSELEGVRNQAVVKIQASSDVPFVLDLSENLNVNT